MKGISTINPAITENMECSIINVHASFINLKVGVSLDYYALFTSSCSNILYNVPTYYAMFQAKNNIRSVPASSALTLISHQSHNVCTAHHHLCAKEERNGVQRRTKVSFR